MAATVALTVHPAMAAATAGTAAEVPTVLQVLVAATPEAEATAKNRKNYCCQQVAVNEVKRQRREGVVLTGTPLFYF